MIDLETGPWHKPSKWYVSPHFWEPAVQEQMPYRPKRVWVKDVTLREGEETPGVVLTQRDRVDIVSKLQELGVAEVEMPMFSASSPEEQKALIRALVDAGVTLPRSYLVVPGARWKEDLDRVIDAGASSISLISQLPERVGFPARGAPRTPEAVLEEALAVIEYCKARDVKISAGSPSTTRLPLDMLLYFYGNAARAGADRVYLTDSMGTGMPASVRYLVRRIKDEVGSTPVTFHCHNDLGLATANTLAAVEGGAEWVDVVINGLGDRAGNASLEEVVTALEVYGVDTGIKIEKLTEVSRFVQERTGVRLQPNKAIVGVNAFLEESAPHFLMTKKAEKAGVPEAAVPYVPELVGQRHVLVIGSSTMYGGAIEYKLEEWGLNFTAEQLDQIRAVAEKRIAEQSFLTEDQFKTVCESVLGPAAG